jgi:hypothetical protein
MIEPGPPVLEGHAASGLGAPILPATPATEPAATPAPPVQTAALIPYLAEPATPTDAALLRSASLPPGEATAGHSPGTGAVTGAAEAEPQLIEAPRLVDPATHHVARRAVPAAATANVRLAALVPIPLAPTGDAQSLGKAPGTTTDPFALERRPMRHAADLAAIGAMEHRWCLANALGAAPGEGNAGATASQPAWPSLMTVAAEQSSPEELALYEPSCLTSEPVLHAIAKLSLARE